VSLSKWAYFGVTLADAAHVMRDWLNAYEYRVDINPLIFVICGLVAIVLAWAAVGWQVLKVARRNPIHALHYE
jgi:putative ABC transport system permease protein